MKKSSLILLGLLINTAILVQPAFAVSVAVDVDPNTPGIQALRTVEVNEVFSVDIVVLDVTDLHRYAFDLDFPTELSALSANDGGFLVDPTLVGSPELTAPDVNMEAMSLAAPPTGSTGSGVLATISFQALSSGTALLDLNDVEFNDPEDNEIDPGTLFDGTINITEDGTTEPIPEPSTILLLGSGLLLGGWIRANSQKKTI